MIPSIKARLIQGAFVCPNTDNPNYEALKNDKAFRLDVDAWLRSAGFQLNETAMGGAFFAGARHINLADHATEIRSQFKEAYEANAFTTLFLNLLRAARDASLEFKSGELLRSDEIFQALSTSETHLARLRMLWNKLVKKNKDLNNYDMLIACLDELAERGYLLCEDKKLGNYRVCGKIEHLFDMIEYAIEHAPKDPQDDDAAPGSDGDGRDRGASAQDVQATTPAEDPEHG